MFLVDGRQIRVIINVPMTLVVWIALVLILLGLALAIGLLGLLNSIVCVCFVCCLWLRLWFIMER